MERIKTEVSVLRWLCTKSPRFLTNPCPLDGCPLFADFRVHGLNKTAKPFPFSFPISRCTPALKALEKRSSSTHVR